VFETGKLPSKYARAHHIKIIFDNNIQYLTASFEVRAVYRQAIERSGA